MAYILTVLTTKQAARTLERTLEVALGGLAHDVDGHELGVVQVLQTHEGLDEQWLGVPEDGL